MIKVLFLIHDLSVGGAEKVLVNLVNNMDSSLFDITVMTLFGGGVNERFLKPHIKLINHFKKTIRGNTHILKLFSPETLHNYFIKQNYDIEVSYLEGPCARIISGCQNKETKLVSWIHIEQHTKKCAAYAFRNYLEASACYNKFHLHAFVSKSVQDDFCKLFKFKSIQKVIYNVNESEQIREFSREFVSNSTLSNSDFKIIGVGKITPKKGFMRLAKTHKRLRDEGFPVHTYVLGIGPQQQEIESYLINNSLQDSFTFLGYQTNPYKYIEKCDLFVCTSHAEGFSTATTEALIIGTPVCTTRVSGMEEMLGKNNEYGVITENEDEALYAGIKELVSNSSLLKHYKKQAELRGLHFSKDKCVANVETVFKNLYRNEY